MKTRTVFVLVFVITFASVATFLCLQQQAYSGWNNLVSETEKQFKHLKKLNEEPGLRKTEEAEKYLKLLGLDKSHQERKKGSKLVQKPPLVAIPAASGQGSDVLALIETVTKYMPFYSVIVYDLGLGYFERRGVRAICNVTQGSWFSIAPGTCVLTDFLWHNYPSHVQVMDYGAYTPIIIQEVLNLWGSVLYLTPNHRIVTSEFSDTIDRAKKMGLVGWNLPESTSAITHHKLFAFFHAKAENFYFHRTISSERLLIYDTPAMHTKLMQPWVQCAVTYRCVSPIGAQSSGCRTHRKPLYLYSGCHGYNWSILNVVLGLAFQYDSSVYSRMNEDSFFVNDAHKASIIEMNRIRSTITIATVDPSLER